MCPGSVPLDVVDRLAQRSQKRQADRIVLVHVIIERLVGVRVYGCGEDEVDTRIDVDDVGRIGQKTIRIADLVEEVSQLSLSIPPASCRR